MLRSESTSTLDSLEALAGHCSFHQGATPEEMAQDFPPVTLAQVYAVLAFYLAHRNEVDTYVAERAAISDADCAAHEARFNPAGLRARLLARQAATEDMA